VTRPRPHRDLLDELPPWPRPFVSDLRCAPELAVLAVLHTAVRAALVALTAEHPTLADLGPPDEPPTLRYARALVDTCLVLTAALDSYRRATIAAFRICRPCDDDLPF
jgi:hypothetical protein